MFKKLMFTTAAATIMFIGANATMAHDHGMDKGSYNKAEKNIVEIATKKEDFSTLVAALQAADLVETIQNADNITVFAPTNEAFAQLPEGVLENLLKPENKAQLQSILTYHVVGSEIMADDIAMGTNVVETLQGNTLTVTKTDTGVMVNNANVTQADVDAENGVIHVIDSVVLPQE